MHAKTGIYEIILKPGENNQQNDKKAVSDNKTSSVKYHVLRLFKNSHSECLE